MPNAQFTLPNPTWQASFVTSAVWIGQSKKWVALVHLRTSNGTSYYYVNNKQQQHPFNGPFPGQPRWAGTRKVKPIWILLKQEIVSGSGSGIRWAIWNSAPRSRERDNHASIPPLSFFTGWMPLRHPTNSIKALKAFYFDDSSHDCQPLFCVSPAAQMFRNILYSVWITVFNFFMK